MTLTLTTRMAVLIGIFVALMLGVAALFELQHSSAATQAPFVPARMPVHHAPAAAKKKAAATAGVSATLRHQLRLHRVVVAVLFASGVPYEAGVVKAAKLGARSAHAGFVVFDVRSEKTAELVAQKYPGTSDPEVLILRRPGSVITALPGVQESQTVTQAVADARP